MSLKNIMLLKTSPIKNNEKPVSKKKKDIQSLTNINQQKHLNRTPSWGKLFQKGKEQQRKPKGSKNKAIKI